MRKSEAQHSTRWSILPVVGEYRPPEKLEEVGRPSLPGSSHHTSLQSKGDPGFGKLGFPKNRVLKIRLNSKQFDAIGWRFLLESNNYYLGKFQFGQILAFDY